MDNVLPIDNSGGIPYISKKNTDSDFGVGQKLGPDCV